MTRALLSLLLLFTAGFVAAQDSAQETVVDFIDHPARVVTNINGLNVRSSPTIEAENIVGQLRPGQQVHVLARKGDWQQVRSEDGLVGWSHSDYLIDLPPRELGETRRFRFNDPHSRQQVTVDAKLRYIGEHSYIYSNNFGRFELIGKQFDTDIYPETLALWNIEPKLSHEGDERIIILFYPSRFGGGTFSGGAYFGRETMPGEPNPYGNRSGFIGVAGSPSYKKAGAIVLAHELQHLIHHQIDGSEKSWVDEGLSKFTEFYLGYDNGFYANEYLGFTRTPLNYFTGQPFHYGAGLLFMSYIYERFGIEALQAFAARPEDGFAALDAQFASMGIDLDANTFFADWVLANYLQDVSLSDGRYGYTQFNEIELLPPPVRVYITEFPAVFSDESHQFATHYYEFALPSRGLSQASELELELQLDRPALQDAWLQLVQLIDGEISMQRFSAQDIRGQTLRTTLEAGADTAFIALSPFTPSDRDRITPANYSLSIRSVGGEALVATPMEEAGHTELMRAAAADDVVEVSWLLLNSEGNWRETLVSERGAEALRLAAAAGYDDVVALLLLTDIDIHALDANDKTALTLAKDAGHDEVVNLLRIAAMDDGERITQKLSPEEVIAFLAATSAGNLAEVERLIAAGISLDVRDADGRTALIRAARSGALDITLRLLLAGANPNQRDEKHFTPLFHAIVKGHSNIASMLLLNDLRISNNRSLIQRDDYDRTALHLAAEYDQADIVRLLLSQQSRGLNVNSQALNAQKTALFPAARLGRTQVTELLLAAGADPNLSDSGPTRPLNFAILFERVPIVELLLAAGADPNWQNASGRAALHHIALIGHARIAELLLAAGADPALVDDNGQTAAQFARERGLYQIAQQIEVAAQ